MRVGDGVWSSAPTLLSVFPARGGSALDQNAWSQNSCILPPDPESFLNHLLEVSADGHDLPDTTFSDPNAALVTIAAMTASMINFKTSAVWERREGSKQH